MYEPLYDDKHRMIFVSEEEGRPKKERPLQRGIREKLLCSACEGEINQQYEHPNVEVWRGFVAQKPVRGISVTPIQGDDGSWAVHVAGFDYPRFKLLLLSVLWRASVARGRDYAEVALGPHHEERLRTMLREKNARAQADYPCLFYVFTEPTFGLMARPARTKLDGYTSYQFLLPGVLLWFVVGDSTRPYEMAKFAPKEDGSLIAPFVEPGEVPLVKHAARAVQKLARMENKRRPNVKGFFRHPARRGVARDAVVVAAGWRKGPVELNR
ncbi:MAG: hypothetical protein HY699_13115 [Deltaproteobacteria bacterium]|nr:hypothetical protein [Deltaproteobacteria bacterium]